MRNGMVKKKNIPLFDCPFCHQTVATLSYDSEEGYCPSCGGKIFITDMLGFHQNLLEESAPNIIASDYMMIHETLLLFTAIRYFWENNRELLRDSLFVKDGPLSIRAQYSKLVAPIRRFLEFAFNESYPINILGQEKTGRFVDHLEIIGPQLDNNSFFIPSNQYIREEVQQIPNIGQPYGRDTNYGAKVFIKLDNYSKYVLNIPTVGYKENPLQEDLIGFQQIVSTLPTILSSRFENALLPIELANGIASLSTYPSAKVLKMFAFS